MGKTKKWSAEEVAAALRQRAVEGRFTNGRVTERHVQDWYPASRHTVRFALSMLSAEGLVESHQGVGWSALDHQRNGTFELFGNLLAMRSRREWPSMVRDVLAYRSKQLLAGIDAVLLSGGKPTGSALAQLTFLYREKWSVNVLSGEDAFFAELTSSGGTLLDTLAANQLRRVLERVRTLLAVGGELESQYSLLNRLYVYIEAGERDSALRLAEVVVHARDPLYMRYADAAAADAAAAEETVEHAATDVGDDDEAFGADASY